MRYIKPYEYFEIDIGDWILYKDQYVSSNELSEYTTTVPGKIIHYQTEKGFPNRLKYMVKYYNIPDKVLPFFGSDNFLYVYKDEIIAKLTKDEAKMILNAKKYNL